MDISWQQKLATHWLEGQARGRNPHAVILLGPSGVGKRAAADWIVRQHLAVSKVPNCPQYPFERLEHPDSRWIEPAEGKDVIGIEQIRDLVAALSLTSFDGQGKAAVIAPADTMTINAANSLLKTLEEPPGATLLVLVADRIGTLPATILSRCQRIQVPPPGEDVALRWLEALRPGSAWVDALRIAGNAPLAAVVALDELDMHATMCRDFAAVATGERSPLDVASHWVKQDSIAILDWLARQVLRVIHVQAGDLRDSVNGVIDDSVLRQMDTRNLFCYLDAINQLRRRPAGSYNLHLALEGLLIDWAEGLVNCGRGMPSDGMRHMLAGG